MWHHSPSEKGIAIGSGAVEAVCKTLVARHLKCSAMRRRKVQGPAVQTIHAPIKSGQFNWTQTALVAPDPDTPSTSSDPLKT